MNGRLLKTAAIILLISLAPALQAWAQDQSTTEAAAATGIQIENAAICQNVVDRVPIGTGDVFSKDIPKVFCFCKVVGANTPTQITFNWYFQGSLKSTVTLPVQSASWRTWSSKAISPTMTGEWMVEILTAEGTPLESIIFFVK